MDATPEIIKEFLIDCYENLDRLDVELVALEQDPTNAARLASAFRTAHTIKGAAGFLAFSRLERITHAGENLLSKMRDGKLTLDQEITSGLLKMIDAVRAIATHVEQHGHEPEQDFAEVVALLKGLDEPTATAPVAPAPTAPAVPAPVVAPQPTPVAQAPTPSLITTPTPAQTVAIPDKTDAKPAAAGSAAAPAAASAAAVADTALRVDVDLLDKLMTLVGELVLARNQILQLAGESAEPSMANATQRLNLVTSDLQEGVMKTRMQPIGNIWSKFPRVVRDVATSCGKQVRIEMEGKETDLDKTIIEAIKDPLTHIVRNSVDHGVEKPEVRLASGKPAEGVLRLRAFHEGGQINIEIADDGAGIDPTRIKAAALAKGVATAEQLARMNDQEAVRLIFEAGFSTAEKVTNISGRGVGMDVVKTNIEKIGGQVDIQSKVGEGTTLRIRIPLTLAIIPALVVTSADGARYAIPQVNLLELVRLEAEGGTLPIEYIQEAPFYRLRGNLLPLVYLHKQLGLARPEGEALDAANVVVLRADGRQFGLVVDRITDSEEIVVKPLGRHFKQVSMYAGATIMGDGSVALILDVIGLAQRAGVVSQVRGRASRVAESAAAAAGKGDRSSLLLFAAGSHTLMGIPLSCVTRLEEFAPHRIEYSGGQEIVQYGDEIMPLVSMWATARTDAEASRKTIVLGLDGCHAALVVDRIVDIVEEGYALKPISSGAYILGSAVVQDRVTEIVDVDAVVAEARRILAGAAA